VLAAEKPVAIAIEEICSGKVKYRWKNNAAS
jgi:DNA-directed RNA polymerase subunit K/omega